MPTTMIELPRVLGFTGAAGSGKSTAAAWVLRNHQKARPIPFASPLKKMVYELLRVALPRGQEPGAADYINDPALKETPIQALGGLTARRLMQTLGTEWGRDALHPDFWVVIAAGKLERLLGVTFNRSPVPAIYAVIDDVRFANEAEMIRAYGGTLIRIERPGRESTTPAHRSEVFDFPADIVLVNDGTPEELEQKLAVLLPPTSS